MIRSAALPASGFLLLLLAACSAPSTPAISTPAISTPDDSTPDDSTSDSAATPSSSALDCSALLAPFHELSASAGLDVTWTVSDVAVPNLSPEVRAQTCFMFNPTAGFNGGGLALVPTSELTISDYTASLSAAGYLLQAPDKGEWVSPSGEVMPVLGSADFERVWFALPTEVSDIMGDYFIVGQGS
jgi:hypothetical protein